MWEKMLGLDDPGGPWYLLWSGIFGDLSMFAATIAFLRHRNCHTRGCWRLQHHPLDRCRKCARRQEAR